MLASDARRITDEVKMQRENIERLYTSIQKRARTGFSTLDIENLTDYALDDLQEKGYKVIVENTSAGTLNTITW